MARVGDAWDTLLQRGVDVWGALAGSDFHSAAADDPNDRWPCQFAETWLRVPDVTEGGLLRALRAGTAFAEHGHIVRDVEFTVDAPGLPRPAVSGEVITAPAGSRVTTRLEFRVPLRDWEGRPNRVDQVEFVVISSTNVQVLTEAVRAGGRQIVSRALVVPPGGLVVRARGRRVVEDGPDLMFYTNPIRVKGGT